MKTSRGGKRSSDMITSSSQGSRKKSGNESGRGYVTYTFYDAKLGTRTFSGPRRRVMNEAERAGYTESDLISRGK